MTPDVMDGKLILQNVLPLKTEIDNWQLFSYVQFQISEYNLESREVITVLQFWIQLILLTARNTELLFFNNFVSQWIYQ